MIYKLKDLSWKLVSHPMAGILKTGHELVNHEANPLRETFVGRFQSAYLESGYRLFKPYPKPEYALHSTLIDGKAYPVTREIVRQAPFADLIRFRREGSDEAPKVLFVAAMSGHYATLAQDTYREFLPDHDVYVTDWKSARDVPLPEGRFGFEEYVAYLIDFIREIGPDTHVIGICQAAVPALVAAAVMAQEQDSRRPRSLTLMAGPVDIRVNPQKAIKALSRVLSKDMFRLALRTVPAGYPGEGRKVYPGWVQLGVFLSLNFPNHVKKHLQFFKDVFQSNSQQAEKHRLFYDEYMATLDGTGEFYLETLERVFFEFHLPEGQMMHQGKRVDCAAITDIALLTIEGEQDDMCLVGNTEAAQGLCSNLPDQLRKHHLQPGVGHYGVFAGSKYRAEIAPLIKQFMAQHGSAAAHSPASSRRRQDGTRSS